MSVILRGSIDTAPMDVTTFQEDTSVLVQKDSSCLQMATIALVRSITNGIVCLHAIERLCVHNAPFYTNILSDVNECGLDKGGCDHKCINKGGSYHCACAEGYSLQSDNRTCVAGNTILYIMQIKLKFNT